MSIASLISSITITFDNSALCMFHPSLLRRLYYKYLSLHLPWRRKAPPLPRQSNSAVPSRPRSRRKPLLHNARSPILRPRTPHGQIPTQKRLGIVYIDTYTLFLLFWEG